MGIGMFRRHRQRRYRGQKARQAALEGRDAVAAAFNARRRQVPGTPLPVGFINARTYEALTKAAPVPYECYEDLIGATEQELVRVQGIGASTARKIIAEVEAWQEAQEPAQAPQDGQQQGGGTEGAGGGDEGAQGASGDASGGAGGDDGQDDGAGGDDGQGGDDPQQPDAGDDGQGE